MFGCSLKTVTAAKVHSILFGCGGTPPSKFKFKRQWVSPEVLKELSEFLERDSVSRPSSCRSVVMDDEEMPVRYWKDNVEELVNQYLLEFPNGVQCTYIYTLSLQIFVTTLCWQACATYVMSVNTQILRNCSAS